MIDIKTLTIGSHVLVDGKRERVRGLDEDNGLIIRFPAEYVMANEVEPISLTPELLTELGFHKRFYCEDFSQWENYDGVSFFISEEWNAVYFANRGFAKPIKYLHEAEAFLALHGVELIKE